MNNFHPLKKLKSIETFQLLNTFFELNCQKAGVPSGLGSELVSEIWLQRNTADFEKLRVESYSKLLKIIKACSTKSPEKNTLSLLDLSKAKTVVDIGANKLSAINFFGSQFPNIEKLIAIDIVPQQKNFQFPEKSQYIQVDPEQKKLPIEPNSVDVVHIQFVLHHLQTKQHIITMLNQAHTILRPGGRLIIWEESFTEQYTESDLETALTLGVLTDENLTNQFYQLSTDQKSSFITTLDWLINVGNPHMPWTGQYYDWKTWCKMIEQAGFSKQREINLGLRLNGKLKQGVHMFGEFAN